MNRAGRDHQVRGQRNLYQTVGKRKPAHRDQEEFFAALARRIKELRKERGWSLNYMNLTHGYVASQWQGFESGRVITLESLLRIAEIFEVEIGDLIQSAGRFPRRDRTDIS